MSNSYDHLFRRTTAGIKPGLDIITAVLEALGNPHHRLAVIHVAGTNGKGSVCAMLESVLRASGFKTGLYTSPHLIDFSERFRINGVQIPDDRLDEYIQQLEKTADEVEAVTGLRGATFFEISTAIAFQYFADEGVDIAIIETGMGGSWDATNVIIPLVSVITHIDIDHTNFLGDTIEKIASEKAGIIKPGRPVVCAPQSEAVLAELRKPSIPIIISSEAVSVVSVDGASSSVGKKRGSSKLAIHSVVNVDGASSSVKDTRKSVAQQLHSLDSAERGDGPNAAGSRVYIPSQRLKIETHSRNLPPINLPLLGECQRENCAVAVAALEVLADLLDFEPEYKKGLETVSWPARFQTISNDPLVILDGAHNPSAARALVKTLKEAYPRHRIGFIFGFLDDKDSVEFVRILKPLVSKAWAVSIEAPRGTTAEQTAGQIRVAGLEATSADVSVAWNQARDWAVAEPGRLVVITGSLYLKQMLALAGCA